MALGPRDPPQPLLLSLEEWRESPVPAALMHINHKARVELPITGSSSSPAVSVQENHQHFAQERPELTGWDSRVVTTQVGGAVSLPLSIQAAMISAATRKPRDNTQHTNLSAKRHTQDALS